MQPQSRHHPFFRAKFASFAPFLLLFLLTGCSAGTIIPTVSPVLTDAALLVLTPPVSQTPAGAQSGLLTANAPTATFPEAPQTPSASEPSPTVETPAAPLPPAAAPPQYTLTAVLDYTSHHLAVQEQITYTNNTGVTLPDLVLMVDSTYYPNTFQLNNMSWGDGQVVEQVTWETGQVRLSLPRPLAPGEAVSLSISYELFLPSPTPSPEIRPVPFGYTARQTNLVDWYPFVAPYLPGEGWLAHQAGYFGEHLVYEKSDFQVKIQISDDRPELVVAAAAPAERDGTWYRYQHSNARNFAWSVSDQYQVSSVDIGGVTILSYYFPYHTQPGEAALQTTADAVKLYSSLYGAYPHPLLSVVEADFLDGMEYDGLYFLSNGFYNLHQGNPGEYLVAIAAHETAHQWFYGLVGNDQALEPWLDEAFCTYHEKIYYEHYAPEALDWWLNYRIQYFQPEGWVDSSIYNLRGYSAYRAAVYFSGALFLDELRGVLGDELFFGSLAGYVSDLTDHIATTDDFFAHLPVEKQADIAPLLEKYFSDP